MRETSSIPRSTRSAVLRFMAVALSFVVCDLVAALLIGSLPSLPPVAGTLMSSAVAMALLIPLGYLLMLRPLAASVAEHANVVDKLVQSEKSNRILSEESSDIIHCYTSEGRFTHVNPAFAKIFDTTPEEIVGTSLWDVYSEQDADERYEALSQVFLSGVEKIHEVGFSNAVGRRYYLTTITPVKGAAGRVASVVCTSKDITERKVAELELRERERQYSTLVENARDMIVRFDTNLRHLFLNAAVERELGIPVRTTIGKTVAEIGGPTDEAELTESALKRVLTTDTPFEYDQTHPTPAGPRYFQTLVVPEHDEDGDICSLLAIKREVTGRRKAEAALQESERRLRAAAEGGNVGLWDWDLRTDSVHYSSVWKRQIGYGDDEISDDFSEWESRIHPEDHDKAVARVQEFLKAPHPGFENEFRFRHKDGSYRTIEARASIHYDEAGVPDRMMGAHLDVTDRKHTDEALRKSEQRFAILFHRSPVATSLLRLSDGVFLDVNDACARQLGYSREQIVGQTALSLGLWAEPARREDLVARLREKGRIPAYENRTRTASGTVLETLCHAELAEMDGETCIIGLHTDITERKKAEEDRLQLEKYRQQIQRLESLGVLAGGIAHDFNNLLASIFGNVDLARSQVGDEVVSGYLSQAMQSMERARGLTQQLLTFSHGGAPNRRITPLPPVIRETSRFALSGSNVEPRFSISQDLWQCDIDGSQIGQVIQNMVLNAAQAMPMGGTLDIGAANVTVAEREHAALREGSYVLVSIRDHGTGIPAEMLPKIFDPFFTTKTKGHGLGLAICHSIVVRHQGAITVESELGKGTVFRIYLPASEGSSLDEEPAATVEHQGSGRVLVMDDDPALSTLLARMLRSFGYGSVCETNGADTIDCFTREREKGSPFCAVILDLTVPGGMGGREVCDAIRRLDEAIPVFVASGYAIDPIISSPQEHGFTASLSKPFTKAEMAAMLEKHMGKRT